MELFDLGREASELVHEIATVAERFQTALDSAPAFASDPTGTVTFFAPRGSAPIVELAGTWHLQVPPEELARVISEAASSIAQSRATAWAELVNSGDVFGPVEPLVQSPRLTVPDHAPDDRAYVQGRLRDVEMIARETVENAQRTAGGAEASDSGSLVSVALAADGTLQTIDFDPSAVREYGGEQLAAIINDALETATRCLPAPEPVDASHDLTDMIENLKLALAANRSTAETRDR